MRGVDVSQCDADFVVVDHQIDCVLNVNLSEWNWSKFDRNRVSTKKVSIDSTL